jgi:large subunit ribosomal protein L47
VRRTQRAIKQVLTERYYSWRDAEIVAKSDREINLSGVGPLFIPEDFIEEELREHVSETESLQIPAEAAGAGEAAPAIKPEARP